MTRLLLQQLRRPWLQPLLRPWLQPLLRPFLLAATLPVSSCALGEGGGFATLDDTRLSARFLPEQSRQLNDGVLTDQGYVVTVEELSLQIEELAIQQFTGASNDARFDPAHPPAGYTLCHGGHCHAEDGSLPSYDEVEASLLGGTRITQTVASLNFDAVINVLDGESLSPATILPSRELPQSTIRLATLQTTNARIAITAHGNALDDSQEFVFEINEPLTFTAGLHTTISRDTRARMTLDATVTCTARLFDGIHFDATDSDASQARLDGLAANLAAMNLQVEFQ